MMLASDTGTVTGAHLGDGLVYECVKSRVCLDEWVVEAIDYGSEGVIYAATFSGPKAQEHAEQYTAWKNARFGSVGRAATDASRL